MENPRPRSPEAVAFVAGIYEGEGSLVAAQGHGERVPMPVIRIGMTDKDVLDRVHLYLGLGRIKGPYNRGDSPRRKPMWQFIITRRSEVETFVSLVWPWLSERRRDRIREVFIRRRQEVSPEGVVSPFKLLDRHKLSSSQVAYIKNRWEQRLSQRDIAERFDVSQALVWLVIHGHTPDATRGINKLSAAQANVIRQLWAARGGVTRISIAKECGVGRVLIGAVIGGAEWVTD